MSKLHFKCTKNNSDKVSARGKIIPKSYDTFLTQASHIHTHDFGVKIGKNVIIHAGVCIYDDCEIGDNVTIGPNSIIGHYAFYYNKKDNKYNRMLSCGSVRIDQNVEIGALSTIDAGVSATTIIGEGTKQRMFEVLK